MSSSPSPHTLPGPSGDQFEAFAADMFGYLQQLEDHGNVVSIDLDGIQNAVIYDLTAISAVFADKLDHIGRSVVFDRLAHVMGSGLITNYNWETWFPRRRRIVKPLGARSVGNFRQRMVEIIHQELDTWPVEQDFLLHDRVKRLTLRVVADMLFSTNLTEASIEIIDHAVQEIHAWAEADPSNQDAQTQPQSFMEAVAALDGFINNVISSRDPNNPGEDLVGLLISGTHDPEARLDLVGVRDEAVTLILAGHETVTNTICFAIDLLGRNPEANGANPRHVVDEALRLYPPVHITSRAVLKDLHLPTSNGNAVTIPAGWEILVPEYVLYRDPRYFEEPERFLPQRWEDNSPLHLERRAYFPFLTGPKFCVGSHFALLEATEAVAMFQQRFTHEMLDPNPPWGREFATSFAPDRPLPIRLHTRNPGPT